MNKEIQPINVGDITIKPDQNIMMAGPCAIESEDQFNTIANAVVGMGADVIRGGAFKPRTNLDSFQGLGEKGLRYIFEAGREFGVPVVTEVMREDQIELIKKIADGHPFIFQVGSRNAQNYDLLRSVGETGIPVLLKRGKGSNLQEMIGAAQYVTSGGSPVLMCERGIVSFNSGDPHKAAGRFTPDHLAVLRFQEEGFMTIFDPSHAAGRSDHVIPLALSGVAIGANGLIVEVHNDACNALCDGKQALNFDQFQQLMTQAKAIENIVRGNNT
jgi:3-deoxy-7-phosphoheptulonate synthase